MRSYLNFIEARKLVRSKGFKLKKEFNDWWHIEKPIDIPLNPHKIYIKEFIDYFDWIGGGTSASSIIKINSVISVIVNVVVGYLQTLINIIKINSN